MDGDLVLLGPLLHARLVERVVIAWFKLVPLIIFVQLSYADHALVWCGSWLLDLSIILLLLHSLLEEVLIEIKLLEDLLVDLLLAQ